MKEIGIKEIVEFYFDNSLCVQNIHDCSTNKNYRERRIQSYNYETGEFIISGLKKKFNVNDPNVVIELNSYSDGWRDFLCQKYFGMDFGQTQSTLEYHLFNNPECVQNVGGAWLKRTSNPRIFVTTLKDVGIKGIMTYRTITDIMVDGYHCGHRYSNTSSRHASGNGFCCHWYSFGAQQ